jgi:hypothetical protein
VFIGLAVVVRQRLTRTDFNIQLQTADERSAEWIVSTRTRVCVCARVCVFVCYYYDGSSRRESDRPNLKRCDSAKSDSIA